MSEFKLPNQLPAIVLPHCTFLPHGLLPLYIFEERYRIMLRHALEHERLFCVAMAREKNGVECGDVVRVATAGMIRACVRNPDGTSHLLLQGMRRVRFTHWHDEVEFPMADVDWIETKVQDPDKCRVDAATMVKVACKLSETHGTLCQQLREHLQSLPDPEPIVDIVAYNFIRCPSTLQEIVECPVLDQRIDIVSGELSKLVKS